MPQFTLDYATPDAAAEFHKLDAFTRGYIECALWADGNAESLSIEGDGEGVEDATVADLAPKTLERMVADCATFQAARRIDLDQAEEEYGRDYAYSGHDFWLTRNGHGTGFWDRDMGAVGDSLDRFARTFGNVGLYRGDDGRIYLG